MFFLVEFEDGVKFICNKRKITNRQGEYCCVKYVNGARYPAKILESDVVSEPLERMKNGISTSEVPNHHPTMNNNSCAEKLPEETISTYLPLTEFETQCPDVPSVSNDAHINESYVLLDLTSVELREEDPETLNLTIGLKNGEEIHSTSSNNFEPESDTDDPSFLFENVEETSSDSELELSLVKTSKNDKENNILSSTNKKNIESRCSLNLSLSNNEQGNSAKDETNMFVIPCEKQGNRPKKLFCMFCGNFQSKFARHLENSHKDVDEVKKFLSLPKGNTERKQIIERIRKQSQFQYNTNDNVNDGELIVCRRPGVNLQRTATDYSVCQNCKGFFSKNNIRHHAQKCFSYNGRKTRSLLVMGRKVLGRIHPEASNILRRNVFPVLREDNVIRSIRYDRLIILYGNKMCNKYRLQHQHDMIRANLRLLGRYLIALKNINKNIFEFSDLYDPKFFDDVISAVHVIGGLDESSNTYKTPSTAYNLGSLLKKIGKILVNDCIKQKNQNKKENAEDFLKLLMEDIGICVNKTVEETQTRNNRRKKLDMPSIQDIQKLTNYLNVKRSNALEAIQTEYSDIDWMTLSETTLTSIHLFNRRRAGEIERIFIEDFESYSKIDANLLKTLGSSSKKLGENYARFVIRGKLNRTVPVLLDREMIKCVKMILKYRERMGVRPENRYVFGIPGFEKSRHKYLRACNLMRKFSVECGASIPISLRGTKLRKHIATNCINLNLSESEVSDVANFMGHSVTIHKDHYRQAILSREILRMSRVLQLAQGEDDTDSEGEEEQLEMDSEIVENSSTFQKSYSSNNLLQCSTEEGSMRYSVPHERPSFSDTDNDGKKKKKRSTSPFGPTKKKRRWNKEEVHTARLLFGRAIETREYPSLRKIEDLKLNYPCLKNRSASVIKTWISNQIRNNDTQNREAE